jgi:hypothetical protein
MFQLYMQYVMHKNRILSPNNKASQISSISSTATQINMQAHSPQVQQYKKNLSNIQS